jgi:hypothetical protein
MVERDDGGKTGGASSGRTKSDTLPGRIMILEPDGSWLQIRHMIRLPDAVASPSAPHYGARNCG